MSRFRLSTALIFGLFIAGGCAQSPHWLASVRSPSGQVGFNLIQARPHLSYNVTFNNMEVIETSPLVFTLDGAELTDKVKVGKIEEFSGDETYATRGPHSTAVNRYRAARVALYAGKKGTRYTLEIRAFDDGVGYRFIVPGRDGPARVPDEASMFKLPAKTLVWTQDMGGHYEGVYIKRHVEDLRAGEWMGPPVTFKLPDGAYGAITEAGLVNYSGMALQAHGQRGMIVGLAHRQPISFPYRLRYGDRDIARMQKPAIIEGTITTPWRVVEVGKDLNTLVDSDIVFNLSPPPDPNYFPDGVNTAWVKQGRAVWQYVDRNYGMPANRPAPTTNSREDRRAGRTVKDMKDFTRWAGELGFQYNVVEGFWRSYSDDQLRDLTNYGKERGVGEIVWVASWAQRDAEKRRALFKRCHDLGIAGLKIDFFDHEHKEVIDLYHDILRDAAEQQLVLIFHGANKPAGERTWPNELNREAVKGAESSRMYERAIHEVTLPFTRWLAGPADYTPVLLNERRADTTCAHQIASAAILDGPETTWASHPKRLLDSPAVEMIKSIPATWDQTIVLPQSEIGELAAYARRKGDSWFLAVMNGPEPRKIEVPLKFLGDGGAYSALIVRDAKSVPERPRSARVPTTTLAVADPRTEAMEVFKYSSFNGNQTITIPLGAGGGFIARFDKATQISQAMETPR